MSLDTKTDEGPFFKDKAGQKIVKVFNLSRDRFNRFICLVLDTNEYTVYTDKELTPWEE